MMIELLHIAVVVVMSGSMTARQLQEMKRETSQIWRPYGVALFWCDQTPAECRPESVKIDPILLVRSDDRRAARRGRDERSLGAIQFTDGTPGPNISLAIDSIVGMVLDSSVANDPVATWPAAMRDRVIGRAIGRVLAHEIGHFLLGLPTHTTTGMMRAWFTARDLTSPGHQQWTIGKPFVARLQARLAMLRSDH